MDTDQIRLIEEYNKVVEEEMKKYLEMKNSWGKNEAMIRVKLALGAAKFKMVTEWNK